MTAATQSREVSSAAQADTEPLTAPECDQGVRELIASAVRIRPGIHESGDAVHEALAVLVPDGRAGD